MNQNKNNFQNFIDATKAMISKYLQIGTYILENMKDLTFIS